MSLRVTTEVPAVKAGKKTTITARVNDNGHVLVKLIGVNREMALAELTAALERVGKMRREEWDRTHHDIGQP